MFRLIILLFCLTLSSAKLLDTKGNEDLQPKPSRSIFACAIDFLSLIFFGGNHNRLWVLGLDTGNLDTLKVRLGSETEDEAFEDLYRATIESFERRQSPNKTQDTKKAAHESLEVNEKKVQRDILKIVNKFVLSAHSKLDENHIEIVDRSPSLTLNFKGKYSSLSVKHGKNEWNFFIKPPSPLPSWFYEDLSKASLIASTTYVKVPKEITKEFYVKLLRLLKLFLSYPM